MCFPNTSPRKEKLRGNQIHERVQEFKINLNITNQRFSLFALQIAVSLSFSQMRKLIHPTLQQTAHFAEYTQTVILASSPSSGPQDRLFRLVHLRQC